MAPHKSTPEVEHGAFASAREAKEFLVGKIVAEAQRQSVELSDVEVKMLYFSETAWSLPDIVEVSDAFDRDYDRDEYEGKVARLVERYRADARRNDPAALDLWNKAVRTLKREDHYLLVMISPPKQLGGIAKISAMQLLLIGLALTGVFFAVVYFIASIPRN